MRATAYKNTEGKYIIEKDGTCCTLDNSMANALYELVKDEKNYLKFYDDVRQRMESQGINPEKNMPMLEYICKNLTDKMWSNEELWELEDQNIDWMIEQYQKGEALI